MRGTRSRVRQKGDCHRDRPAHLSESPLRTNTTISSQSHESESNTHIESNHVRGDHK